MAISTGKLILAAALFAAGAAGGYGWERRARLAEVATLRSEHADTLRGISNLATAAAQRAAVLQQTWAATLATIDTHQTKERTDALKENSRLAAAVAAGDRRLRIAGACVAAGGRDMPAAAGTTRLDDGAAVELDREAGKAVFDLRADLINDRAALTGLQSYVRQVCAQ